MLKEQYLLFILVAGLLNGSFVIPTKHMKKLRGERIWYYHSLLNLGLLPWIIFYFFFSGDFFPYTQLSAGIWGYLMIGGCIFGLGQVFFAYAIETLGIALSFTINLGIGVTIGSLFVVIYKGGLLTWPGMMISFAVLLILASLLVHYYADAFQKRTDHLNPPIHHHYRKGWFLAVFAGIASGLQNIIFYLLTFNYTSPFSRSDTFWVWPPFLLIAAMVMSIGFSLKASNATPAKAITVTQGLKNTILLLLMGIGFSGSLAIYSDSLGKLTHSQQLAGWPLFMVSIIMASQLWGYAYKDSLIKQQTRSSRLKRLSILLLIVAILILALNQ